MSARPGVQHRRVVHDQHELAGLPRRNDDELLHADGRPRVPQLRVGGGRHRAGHRVHPRHRAAARRRRSATSGSTWCAPCLWVLLPFCIVGALFLVSQGVVQNLQAVRHGQAGRAATGAAVDATASRRSMPRQAGHGHGDRADDRAGPGRVAGDHQGVRHQRRRLLQRQQRASVREPDAALELPRDVRHLRHLVRPHLHARAR